MVACNNVSKHFASFALKNVTFNLPKGYICGLIGENGSGKTTLLKILSGLYSFEGDISVFDKEFHQYECDIKQDIGVVVQDELFEKTESLMRNAKHYGKYYRNYREESLKEYLDRFHLDSKKKYGRLSKGEKLKYALAFALAHHPQLLLLDEPGANFDIEFREEFHRLLREFTSEESRSVILSTHITSDVERFADYILFLKNGEQLLYGDVETIRDAYRMVSGESYKIKLLKEDIIYMQEGRISCNALVKNSYRSFDQELQVWEPSIDELMYYFGKGKNNGAANSIFGNHQRIL